MKGAHCCQPDEAAAEEAAVLMIRAYFAHECARWSPAVLRYYNERKRLERRALQGAQHLGQHARQHDGTEPTPALPPRGARAGAGGRGRRPTERERGGESGEARAVVSVRVYYFLCIESFFSARARIAVRGYCGTCGDRVDKGSNSSLLGHSLALRQSHANTQNVVKVFGPGLRCHDHCMWCMVWKSVR